ncbi:3-hydroxyacyl-CoA dehydrogenase [Thermodesulfobacteriota bacterium]
MKVDDIKKVTIIGAGNMGQQIGVQCAINAFKVILYDVNQDILDNAIQRIKKLLKYFVKLNRITEKEAEVAIGRIKGTTVKEEAALDVDLLSESVPEDPDLKEKVLSEFNSLCPERTIFTTNTSTLVPSIFAEGTGRPEKLVALHFHDVRTTNIVDVMPHPGTSEETFNTVCEFATRIGQIPIILKKENPGYVFNFMLTNLFDSAQTLTANGVTSIEEIDRSWMGVIRMQMGPFGIMDSIGIDSVWKVTEYWANKENDKQKKKNAEYLKKYIEKGYLGRKSGRGFYSYPNPLYQEPDFINGKS